jgi:hypothetical protein
MGRKSYRLLNINDAMSWDMRLAPRKGDEDTYTVNVDNGIDGLRSKLSWMINEGMTFQNAAFSTHGNRGVIWFGHEYVIANTWYTKFHRSGYERLFPFKDTKLYFAGCNVADSEYGWRFLEAAARTLSGGVAIGWTSLGFGSVRPSPGMCDIFGEKRGKSCLSQGETARLFVSLKIGSVLTTA